MPCAASPIAAAGVQNARRINDLGVQGDNGVQCNTCGHGGLIDDHVAGADGGGLCIIWRSCSQRGETSWRFLQDKGPVLASQNGRGQGTLQQMPCPQTAGPAPHGSALRVSPGESRPVPPEPSTPSARGSSDILLGPPTITTTVEDQRRHPCSNRAFLSRVVFGRGEGHFRTALTRV